jgi:hypothetical protein
MMLDDVLFVTLKLREMLASQFFTEPEQSADDEPAFTKNVSG